MFLLGALQWWQPFHFSQTYPHDKTWHNLLGLRWSMSFNHVKVNGNCSLRNYLDASVSTVTADNQLYCPLRKKILELSRISSKQTSMFYTGSHIFPSVHRNKPHTTLSLNLHHTHCFLENRKHTQWSAHKIVFHRELISLLFPDLILIISHKCLFIVFSRYFVTDFFFILLLTLSYLYQIWNLTEHVWENIILRTDFSDNERVGVSSWLVLWMEDFAAK